MKRKLPKHIIEGTAFVVDVDKRELRQADNPENVIPFQEMQYKGSYYEFSYDLVNKNVAYRFGYNIDQVKEISLPQLVALNPEGMANKYNIAASALKGKTDYDIMVDQKLLAERLSGKLPVVDIAGDDFIVDYRLRELRPKDDFSTSIRLHDLAYVIELELYWGYYHLPTHQMVGINAGTIQELPEDVVVLEIPFERKLDPVGYARENQVDVKDILVKYPPEEKQVIHIIPLEETNLPNIAKENRQRASQRNNVKPAKALKIKRSKRL